MPYEQRDDSGSIFQNDRKTKEEQPGWKGSARIGGVDYWVSGWVKQTQDGKKWVSLAFQEKQPKPEPTPKDCKASMAAQAPAQAPFNDDIPFNRLRNEYVL